MVKLEGFFFILRASVNDLMHSIHFHIIFHINYEALILYSI